MGRARGGGKKRRRGSKGPVHDVTHRPSVEPQVLRLPEETCKKVLLIGSGDLSFAVGLVVHRHHSGEGIVATTYDKKSELEAKYGRENIFRNISMLEENGVDVLHEVDGRRLDTTFGGDTPPEDGTPPSKLDLAQSAPKQTFSHIIFNFPHVRQRTHENRVLIRRFFGSAARILDGDVSSEILVTLQKGPPYSEYNIESLATEAGLVLKDKVPFDPKLFKPYGHVTTDPTAKPLDISKATTYIFARRFDKWAAWTQARDKHTPLPRAGEKRKKL